jgi:hypothetical protein
MGGLLYVDGYVDGLAIGIRAAIAAGRAKRWDLLENRERLVRVRVGV